MSWGLFVQPGFIARYMEMDSKSQEFLSLLKSHAIEMIMRMMEQRKKP